MRLERETGKNLIHINEDEIGKTWQTGVDVEEVNISSEEERRIYKTGEDGTESAKCGGEHRTLRVYKASPGNDQEQHMEFTTVLISSTTTSAMVVEESLRRLCNDSPPISLFTALANLDLAFHLVLPGSTWPRWTPACSPLWSS